MIYRENLNSCKQNDKVYLEVSPRLAGDQSHHNNAMEKKQNGTAKQIKAHNSKSGSPLFWCAGAVLSGTKLCVKFIL